MKLLRKLLDLAFLVALAGCAAWTAWKGPQGSVLVGTAVFCGVVIAVRRLIGSRPRTAESPLAYAGDTLVLLVRGLGSSLYVHDVANVVREQFPTADIIQPSFDSSLWSRLNVTAFSEKLAERVNDAVEERKRHGDGNGYKRIILIGHSIGALLVRAVYLISLDYAFSRDAIRKNWKWPRVERIVMLSGLGAGWYTPPVGKVGWLRSAAFHAMVLVARLTGRAKFMMSVREGASFVADLRCHWLDLAAEDRKKVSEGAPSQMPITCQVEGDADGLVTREDIRDYVGGENFSYFQVSETEHFNVGVFTEDTARAIVEKERSKGFTNILFRWLTKEKEPGPEARAARKRHFVYALTEPKPSGRSLPTKNKDLAVRRVVWVLHGIRDSGDWTGTLAKAIEAEGSDLRGVATSYGRFSLFEFLAPFSRRFRVEWFMREYLGLRADYPNAVIDMVAHSFGTYLISKALQIRIACKFGRIALAGSVVRRDYSWRDLGYAKRVEQVRNYRGSMDFIVGCMPGIWEYPPLRALTRWRDLFGSAGFLGFTEGRSEYFTQAIVRGCHGAALVNTNQPSIHEFILRGKETDPNPKADESASATVALLLSVAGLALLVTIGVYLWPHGIGVMAAYLATILLILVYF